MLGKPPDPSKILAGAFPTDQPAAHGPLSPAGLPDCPDYLDATAKTKWAELCQALADLDLLAGADRDTMAMYCAAFSQWREADDMVKKSGLVIKTAGGIGANPCVQIAANAKREMLDLAELLGLDPASRSRFRVKRRVG